MGRQTLRQRMNIVKEQYMLRTKEQDFLCIRMLRETRLRKPKITMQAVQQEALHSVVQFFLCLVQALASTRIQTHRHMYRFSGDREQECRGN